MVEFQQGDIISAIPLRWACHNSGVMAKVPFRRMVLYITSIVVLGSLLVYGDGGLLSNGSIDGLTLFNVPGRDQVAFVNQLDERAPEDLGTNSAGEEGDDPNFDFSGELNRLSSPDSASEGGAPQAAKPTPVVPTVVPSNSSGDYPGGRDSRDTGQGDARNIFSGLDTEPEPGWNGTGVLGGITSRSGSLMGAGAIPTAVTTPSNARPWVQGQARGYTMLYAMQPQARPVVEDQVQTLLAARVREPYIGVLIDGTFSRDFSYLKDIITRLSADNRALTVALYLVNGPGMRKTTEPPIGDIFSQIDPVEFRQRIRRDQLLRSQFSAIVSQARDVFEHNASLNGRNNNVAIVMLEDNLDAAAYRSMRDLASEQLDGLAGFIRNPCLGCIEGNDDVTLGNPREEHMLERFSILQQGDAFSLDGVGFRYPNSSDVVGVSADELATLMNASFERGLRYFGLWRHAWQGRSPSEDQIKHPNERTYVQSTPDQQEFEIEALRTGLIPEVQSEAEE